MIHKMSFLQVTGLNLRCSDICMEVSIEMLLLHAKREVIPASDEENLWVASFESFPSKPNW